MAYGAHVQSRGAIIGNSPTQSLAFLSNVTIGNTIVVGIRYSDFGGNPTITITDTLGNTYVNYPFTRDVVTSSFHYCLASVGSGANTITVNVPGETAEIRCIIGEYEGSSLLNASNLTQNGGTTLNSGNFTTTVATTLIIGFGSQLGTPSYAPGTNFTERVEISTRIALEDRVVTSTGTYNATMTTASNTDYIMVGWAFSQGSTPVIFVPKPFMLNQAVKRAALY